MKSNRVRSHRGTLRLRRQRRKSTAAGRPCFEALEGRQLLSAGDLAWGPVMAAISGFQFDYQNAITTQADGRILVGGYVANGIYGKDFAVARYTTAGILDATFAPGGTDGDGIASLALAGDQDAKAIAIDAAGNILLAGASDDGVNQSFAVTRFTSAGAVDTSFNTTGYNFAAFSTAWSDNFNGAAQQTWTTTTNGNNSTFLVQNNRYELHTESGDGTSRFLASYVGGVASDCLMQTRVQQIATGDKFLSYLMARANPATMSSYVCGASSDGTKLWFGKLDGGAYTGIESTGTAPTYDSADFQLRFAVYGSTLLAKAWTTGTAEPADWQITATDTSYASGVGGVMSPPIPRSPGRRSRPPSTMWRSPNLRRPMTSACRAMGTSSPPGRSTTAPPTATTSASPVSMRMAPSPRPSPTT